MKHFFSRLKGGITALFSVTALFLGSAHKAEAATYTWDGAEADLKSFHWLPGNVGWPGADHAMVVNSGLVKVIDSNTAYRPQTLTINGGTVRVTGGGRLFPGSDATSRVITINTGGVLELDTWFKADSQSLGRLMPDAGRLVINGGTLRVFGETGYGRGATVNAAGATLEAAGGANWLLNNLTDDNAWVYNGNPTLTFSGAGEGRFDKVISGGCSVIKRGPGKWTLARSNTYTGNTTVEQGVLTVRRAVFSDTSTISIASGAILSLRHEDGDVVGSVILGGVTMPAGSYSKSTHPQYFSGSGRLIVGGTATTGTGPLTWFYGGGGDTAIQDTLTASMNAAVDRYNDYGYFRRNVRAEYNAGVPTAQAGYNGPITFGGSRNARTALHEFGHVFGAGTRGEWGANLSGGVWQGRHTRRLIQQIEGPGAVINSDGTHFWPFGLNYDSEGGTRNEICHVRIMEALNMDMGLFEGSSTMTELGDRSLPVNGTSGPIAITVGDPSAAATQLGLIVHSTNPTLLPTGSLVLSGSGATRTLTITPAADQMGIATITLAVSGGREAAFQNFRLTVGTYTWLGGAGTWDTVSPQWAGVSTLWPDNGGNNDATFSNPGGTITVAESVIVDDAVFSQNGYDLVGGSLNLQATPTFTIAEGVSVKISSNLVGSAGAFTKAGPGRLELNGTASVQAGIAATEGLLNVSGDIDASGNVDVRSGATLCGTGSLPLTDIQSGAILSPGASEEPGVAGALRFESLIYHTSTVVMMDVGSTSADQITVDGNLTLKGTLNIRLIDRPLNGSLTLMTYGGTLTGTMTLGQIPAGYSMMLDTTTAPGEVRLIVQSGGLETFSLIPAGATWSYWANASTTGPSALWNRLDFPSAASWATGRAEFGYGDGDEVTALSLTSGKPLTAYFRHTFSLTAGQRETIRELRLRLLRDDGAAVYLNGQEIRRDNFTATTTPITHNQLAAVALGAPEEALFIASYIDPTWLNTGENVLAVEIHQADAASSDLSFDLQFDAILDQPDSDTDGLVDAWERRIFGSLTAQTGDDDSDADGQSNAIEMKARTFPDSATSSLKIESVILRENNSATLTWPSSLGVVYQVRYSLDCQEWHLIPDIRYIGNGAVMSMTPNLPAEISAPDTVFFQIVAGE